jgi:hypothetical protein
MRKLLFLMIMAILLGQGAFAQKSAVIKLNNETPRFEVKSLKSSGFIVESAFSEIKLNPVTFSKGNFMTLEIDGLIKIFDEGMPNIPVMSKLIEVPQGADVEFIVKSYDEEIIQLSDYGITDRIQPALRSQSKSEDNLPFTIKESVYNTDAYSNIDVVVYEESGQMRDIRLGRVEIRPIQYNPVKNTLRILNNLVIEVKFNNADYTATEKLKRKYSSPFFNASLAGQVINFEAYTSKELITQAPTHLVIVSARMFETQLQPYIAWKVKKGFKVTVAYTDVIGTTTTAIKTYLQGIYQGSDPMTFVLFVGDVAQIPAWAGNSGSHVTDLRYCEYTGDDIPEVYYGRFSAQNTSQLQPQLDKSLEYEQYLMDDPSYLEEVVMVAGDDASYEEVYGNGQINYGTTYYFNEDNDIFSNTYLQPLNNGTASTQIIQNVSDGVSYGNYTAHCGPSGWSTPSFETSDIPGLQNASQYGLLVGNCCLSNKFDDSECFGEGLLRAVNKGAIGYIGGSNSTYWDEDYWWGCGLGTAVQFPVYENFGTGAYDGYFHNLANEANNLSKWFVTQGQMVRCGQLAVEASSSSRKEYYWEIYHLMGDPTLLNYIGIPQTMTVTPSPGTLMIGMTNLNVSSAPYTYVALSQGGVLVAAAVSDENGNASLTFAADDLTVGSADLVVTRQNTEPYIGTITISPANQPYVVLNSYTTNIDPDYGQTVDLNVTLENVAASGSGYNATNVVATIALTDPYVTIVDGSATYGTINAGTSSLVNSAFQIAIADNVPDQYTFSFTMTITGDGGYTWPATFTLTADAPTLTVGNLTINDAGGNADGILDPGETADVLIQTTNTGHADVSNVIGQISTTSPYLILNTTSTSPVSLLEGEAGIFSFNVMASAAAEEGTLADLLFSVTGGTENQYSGSNDFDIVIGFVPEYCEASGGCDEYITRVQFGTIDNSSACDSYHDYTAISTEVDMGSSYPITVTVGTPYSSDALAAYVDWNYDGDFDDAGESFPLTWASPNATGNIMVPEGITPRNLTMRIRLTYNSTPAPCGTTTYGEVEDYTLTVLPGITQGGTLNATNSMVCIGSSTGTITLSNNSGTVTDWEKRLNGGAWTSIGNTASTYSETTAEAGTWEYRVAVDAGAAYSTVVSIVVNPLTVSGSVSGGSTVCEGENTGTLTLSGHIGNVQRWQKQLNGGTWSNITNSLITYSEIPSADGTWSYRAVVKSGVCSEADSESTDVLVNPSAVSGTATVDDNTICTGSTVTLTLTSYEGSIQWQVSDNGTDWSDITDATTNTYATDALTANTWYRAVVSLGECNDAVSNSVAISISENPVSGFTFVADNQTLTFTNTSTNATSYSWDFGDTFSSTQTNPVHTFAAAGNYTVVLTAINGVCPDNEYEQTIAVTYVGVDDLNANVLIQPNPSDGRFFIQSGNYKMTSLSIYNVSGQKIYETVPMNTTVEVDLNQVVPGIYFIEIIANNMKINKKLIIN